MAALSLSLSLSLSHTHTHTHTVTHSRALTPSPSPSPSASRLYENFISECALPDVARAHIEDGHGSFKALVTDTLLARDLEIVPVAGVDTVRLKGFT